jgi:hypothetical protein
MDDDALLLIVRVAAAQYVPVDKAVAGTGLKDEYRRRLAEWRMREPDIEFQCTVPAGTPQVVFTGLCVVYGLVPYRRARQRKTTMCVRAPRAFVHELFWPQFEALAVAVEEELCRVVRHTMESWSGVSSDERFGPIRGYENEPLEVR